MSHGWGWIRSERSRLVRYGVFAVVLFAFLLILSPNPWASLPDPETSQPQRDEIVFNLSPGGSAAQIFYARQRGLNSLAIWLTAPQSQTRVEVHIQQADGVHAPFVQTSRVLSGGPTALTMTFAPQNDPPGQAYRVQVTCPEADCAGVQVLGRTDPDSDPTGWAALPNGASLPADIAYTTTTAYTLRTALEDAGGLLLHLPQLALALGVVLLPGWALLSLLHWKPTQSRLDLPQTIALALGLSLGLVPLLLLLTTTLGLRWQGWMAAIALLAAAAVVVFRPLRLRWGKPSHLASLALIFAASLLVRLAMVRNLAGPPWVDAFHHALFTRLILDLGAFPGTLEPYLSLPVSAYHPGFHASLALFTGLSGLDLPAGMLFFGQVLNALVVFPVYALTLRLTGSVRAALAAALAAGLLSPMPAYYTSWGRYTHLAGMLILPAFILLARHVYLPVAVRRSGWQWVAAVFPAAAAFGGLMLVHYRVALFAALLAGIDWLLNSGASTRRLSLPKPSLPGFTGLALVGLAGLLFASPWIVPAFTRTILPQTLQPAGAPVGWFAGFGWSSLASGLGGVVLAGAGAGLVAGIVLRRRFVFTLLAWIASLLLLANLGAAGLPGGSLVNSTAVTISLFLPLCILAGWGADQASRLLEWARQKFLPKIPRLASVWALAAVLLGVFGAQRLVPLLNPATFLLREADLTGLAWASDNLPQGALVVVNPFNWGYGVYAPADGAGWLAGASALVSLPSPVIAGIETNQRLLAEQAFVAALLRLGTDPEGLADLLHRSGVAYVFAGRRGGVIAPQHLLTSPAFTVLYNVDGVRIFKVNP